MIADNPGLLKDLPSNYNIVTGTRGGPVWWKDLASHKGWRLQQNRFWLFSGNCRLLDPYDDRKAWWRNKKAMLKAFEEFAARQGLN
jgi:hypothetical protein